jgi:hypothetical protein
VSSGENNNEVSLCQGGALQTCGVKAYKAIKDQRLYFSSGRLFLGETVYYTENSTYTELEPYVRGCVLVTIMTTYATIMIGIRARS